MKTTQYFTDEYLEHCKNMTTNQIAVFLENFRIMQAPAVKSKLISLKVQEPLLKAFKIKSGLIGVKYQTQIKNLMLSWLSE